MRVIAILENVPLSNPKKKHEKMRNKIDFKKIVYQGEWIGVLNFNLMIPVEDSLIQKIDTRIRRHDNMDTGEQCLDFKRMEIECKKFTEKEKVKILQIETYSEKYRDEIISLILDIQNNEAKIDLPLEEQPDLLDIHSCYQQKGGEFWVALSDGKVIGTIGLLLREQSWAIMKKFFVKREFRSQKIGLALYQELLQFAKAAGVLHIILDTPSVAHASHRFYEKSGFRRIDKSELPVPYSYPDRKSILYMLEL